MNNCPDQYKVHYRQPDGLMGTVGVVKGTAHEKYNEDHKFSHNVGLVEVRVQISSFNVGVWCYRTMLILKLVTQSE